MSALIFRADNILQIVVKNLPYYARKVGLQCEALNKLQFVMEKGEELIWSVSELINKFILHGHFKFVQRRFECPLISLKTKNLVFLACSAKTYLYISKTLIPKQNSTLALTV